jgi:hypothetical protein
MLRSGEGEPAVRRAERALASQEGRLTVLAPQNCAGDNAIPTHLTDGETEAGRDRPPREAELHGGENKGTQETWHSRSSSGQLDHNQGPSSLLRSVGRSV